MARHVRAAFTLIELLVVIAVIAVIISLLVPSLSGARNQAMSVKCKANLQMVGVGLVMYTDANDGYIVPSYNLPALGSGSDTSGGPSQPFDGWPSILDRDNLVSSPERTTNSTFFCPKTIDVEGMKDGQTGTDPNKPRGWTDWPLRFLSAGGDSSPKEAVTIPEWGFYKIIRASYWLNAYNPVGNSVANIAPLNQHYSASVGWGPDGTGEYIRNLKLTSPRCSEFITAADGIYAGRHAVTRIGEANSRIGYRHPGMSRQDGMANVAFADGHVEPIVGNKFPRAIAAGDSQAVLQEKKAENLSGPTIYSNAKLVFSGI